jgi:hypothetical protein
LKSLLLSLIRADINFTMKLFNTVTVFLATAAVTSASPIEDRTIFLQSDCGSTWTVVNMKRLCSTSSCHFTYSINKNDGSKVTPCDYNIAGISPTPASQTNYQNLVCGSFTIGSIWNSQGFTVLSMVSGNQIIYPGYTDDELNTNKAVKPNKSYTPQQVT